MKSINNSILLAICLSLSLALSACFSLSKEKEEEKIEIDYESDSGEDMEIHIDSEEEGDIKINIDLNDPAKALEGLSDKIGDLADKLKEGEGNEVEVINFRELKEMLPSRVAGMRLDDSSGETTGAMGFKISTAIGKYQDDDQKMEVTIADVGASPIALMGMAAWSNVEFERDSDEGYERTTTIEGHKAYEKYDAERENGQVSLIINNRFLVNIEGRNVSEKDLRSALKRVDLDELESLSKK